MNVGLAKLTKFSWQIKRIGMTKLLQERLCGNFDVWVLVLRQTKHATVQSSPLLTR
jgi:hypothetical protein